MALVPTRTLYDSETFEATLEQYLPSTVFDVLAEATGADGIGYQFSGTKPAETVAQILKNGRALTPADFSYLVTGGQVAAGANDTPAFAALVIQYTLGRAIHIPDLGSPYLVDPDTLLFTPPTSYNNLNRTPPAITMDKSAVIRARSGGTYLVQLGLASYNGYLRNADFDLGVIDGYNFTFTKAPLYIPFFRELRINVTCKNNKRAAWYGDSSAPTQSAGIKGKRTYERDLELWRRDTVSITNAANPIVTFVSAHGLWPSTGRRVVCLNFVGAPMAWDDIDNKSLDCLILSATTLQLLNVDSSGYGALTGFAACYLNFESMRVSKQISGVTNANPCVVTTAIPHLFTSGDSVDLAEIGGMSPNQYRNAGTFTGLQDQFVVTVLSPTTFSIPINTTNTGIYGAYNSGLGPGWAMGWVAPADCDIAEYHDNTTDVDDGEMYSFHYRIHQFHNPSIAGYDGKHGQAHFYNFPESGEALCHYYTGGDNHFYAIQSDGPFRYVLMLFGPSNTANGCKTNTGYIDPVPDGYGAFARGIATNASLIASELGLKSRSGFELWSDWSGPGYYQTDGSNRYNNVLNPIITYGVRQKAAQVRFSGAGTIQRSYQVTAVVKAGTGTYNISLVRPVPLTSYFSASVGNAAMTIGENEAYGSRSPFERQVIVSDDAGAPVDPTNADVFFEYAD